MDHEHFMRQALREAQRASDADEVPVGAVIVMQNKLIGRGYNQVETLNDSTAHAEIIALTSAFNYLGSKYLPEATMYVTVEPCAMCCGALFWSKIGRLVYGADDPKNGGISRVQLHPRTEIEKNILSKECLEIMQRFFRKKR
jgi:tRNA(adenine34) deaminase